MKQISVQDLKAQLSGAIAAAEAGETWTVTRHNRPVAQLGPAGSPQRAVERDPGERLTPAVTSGTNGRYLTALLDDRGGR